MYRLEMNCQVIWDSIHERGPGWTQEYVLRVGRAAVGYGSVAVGGPWAGAPAAYEFFVVPTHRTRVFELCDAFLRVSGAVSFQTQTNDRLTTALLLTFARPVTAEAILFHDKMLTSHAPRGAVYREATAAEEPEVPTQHLRWRGVVEVDGQVAATGGVLFHY